MQLIDDIFIVSEMHTIIIRNNNKKMFEGSIKSEKNKNPINLYINRKKKTNYITDKPIYFTNTNHFAVYSTVYCVPVIV